MFLGLPDPDPLVRDADPILPTSRKQKKKKFVGVSTQTKIAGSAS
jgi:hypothetical protein